MPRRFWKAALAIALTAHLAACSAEPDGKSRDTDSPPAQATAAEVEPTGEAAATDPAAGDATPTAAPTSPDPAPATEDPTTPPPTEEATESSVQQVEGFGFDPDPGFLTGIEEAWRVPGLLPMNDLNHTRFAVWLEGSMVSVYDATPEPSEPIWHGGPCGQFGFFADRFLCDSTVINPADGSTVPLGEGYAYVHGNDEHLMMLTPEGTAIGYDTQLTEVWRRDGVEPLTGESAAGTTTMGLTLVPVQAGPDAPQGTQFSQLDVATGELVAGGAQAQEVTDGYFTINPTIGEITGWQWDGTEGFVRSGQRAWAAPMPRVGRLLTLADVQACVDVPDAEKTPTATSRFLCLTTDDTTLMAEFRAPGFVVDGVEYPDAGLALPFLGTDHLMLIAVDAASPSVALHARGSEDPIWQVDVDYGLIPMAGGDLMLGSLGGETILFRPAG
ncbi:MAG: hypothetical protein Q4G64_10425 [bacterium]|nr:hypothetical protein [bacterium]